MILIISNSTYEPTTDAVVDWLLYHKANFIRISPKDFIDKENNVSILVSDSTLKLKGKTINLNEIKVVWYRRWFDYVHIPIKGRNNNEKKAFRELSDEITSVLYYLSKLLGDRAWLNNPITTRMHNKLFALEVAEKNGLKIPATLITSDKQSLIEFFKKSEEIITKPIGDVFVYSDEEENIYKSYTEIVKESFIDKLSNNFFLSVFQKRVKAELEIRCFFIEDKFYPTAIINNRSVDIKLSVRQQTDTKMVKYKLPLDIELKLHKTMMDLDLNSGSIDLLKGEDGQFYFLEVNPVGQFSGYGSAGNFQLEQVVAKWLIEKDN